MNLKLAIPALILAILFGCSKNDYTKYVDPNIGSVSTLLTTKNPTVHRPHSMVRVFPVTEPGLNDRYLSDKIYGFAINMPAYRMGKVSEIMPVHGEVYADRKLNAAVYDHDLEEVHPWYHQVILEEPEILAAWTTTEQAVLYRFEFSTPDSNSIVLRTKNNAKIEINQNTIAGWEEFQGSKQFFHGEFDQSVQGTGIIKNGVINPNETSVNGNSVAAYVEFEKLAAPVELRFGISFISEEQAKENLISQAANKSFDEIKDISCQIWKDNIGQIEVKGGTERQKRIFYTSLYRTKVRMVDISEDGRYYSGYDKELHQSANRPFFVDDWLWDTFRSSHPLGMILDPEREGDMVQSYTSMYEQDGWMPGFPQFYGDFPAMIGFHSAALVWDTYQKGEREFNVGKAYEGLKKNAMKATMLPWRVGPMCVLDTFYLENGWYPALAENEPEPVAMVHGFEKRQAVALTLEHSYDDWCLAQLAKALNKTEDYNYFMGRSQNYRNVFNAETGFMSPRKANGEWVADFDPQLSGGIGSRMYFAENNAWPWSFNVMHDIYGLIDLMGGNKAFVERLDRLFNQPTNISKWQFMGQFPDATGLNGMFPAGNEPSFHIPYLYNYAGQPWKTQRRIREIMDMWFDDAPLGLPGDEDGGALCAWYVFSGMGFYPVTPGTGLYAIGSPFFEEVKIHLPADKTFVVKANKCTKANKYIQSARLNGQSINRPWIKHTEIMNGGVLELEMGNRPNKNWGTDTSWYKKEIAKLNRN
ncbi:GH92 family glycosyl hydrolase [Sunxiuqinia sp. A32]|uniref:GH92 family glycosyl hydrolase n=1 Tax=Sunxiuqinia sp. A32 TaxID=3461496 RepID=UPI00404640D2